MVVVTMMDGSNDCDDGSNDVMDGSNDCDGW